MEFSRKWDYSRWNEIAVNLMQAEAEGKELTHINGNSCLGLLVFNYSRRTLTCMNCGKVLHFHEPDIWSES